MIQPELHVRDRSGRTREGGYWHYLRVDRDGILILAEVGFSSGQEHLLAVILHELVARNALDIEIVKHWFERCSKGDGPDVVVKKDKLP